LWGKLKSSTLLSKIIPFLLFFNRLEIYSTIAITLDGSFFLLRLGHGDNHGESVSQTNRLSGIYINASLKYSDFGNVIFPPIAK
jgi:hypothetical protein